MSGVGAVGGAQDGGRRVDDRQKEVGVEHGIESLHHGEDPLQAHAGVDVLAGQVAQRAVGVAVVLHEDEVPDLDEARVATVLGATVVAIGRPEVHEDLRIGPARARVAHRPEVVLVAHALNALGAHTDLVDPELLGLVVALVHRDPEAIAVEAEDFRQELPGHRDRLGLEVVPEAEVAQHLEEGAVVGVGPDDLDVGGPEALLDGRGPGPGRRLLPLEVGLEGHHARDGEEDRGVVRNEAGGGDDGVAPVRKEARKGRPQSVGVHVSSLPGAKTDLGPPRAQAEDIPTIGLLREMLPVDP